MKIFTRFNLIGGFCVFAISLVVYWLCMEPTVSFWDCGEFIAASFKMEVGHQPGAPLFLMIGRLFSMLAGNNTANVAYWTNFVSVASSAATVMFLFWSINAIALKIVAKKEKTLNITQVLTIITTGTIGALAYTFSDTFWFSAVEAEVYAISSLCTAVVFWAILKWEVNLNDKWLLFIAFIIGISIGMHLLSLLSIPAIALVYYFRKTQKASLTGTLKAFFVGCLLLGIVQFGIIQYVVLFAAKSDLFFVNSLGTGFGIGAIAFLLAMFSAIAYGIFYAIKKSNYKLNLSLLCLVFVLFGFSSYFMIIIRANAKPNINLSNPDSPMSLYGYLSREQYEAKPLAYGQFYTSKPVDAKEAGLTYRKGDKKYEVIGKTYKSVYDKNTIFPRTYSDRPDHVKFYESWMGLAQGETPTFWQNVGFFNSYQVGFMYWRYFFWNFVGRQNDIQGHGNAQDGNWLSGIKPIDAMRLGNQSQLPESITKNEGYNLFYGLPLILGILGIIHLYRKNKRDALTVATLFFCTGLAIILYINQDPLQVRERDYAYVGSFYAFAIFIGLGFLAIKDLMNKFASNKLSLAIATSICLVVGPVLMAVKGWDDHDRSGKTTALEMAKNYLNSCEPNAILFVNADNDTYPLWYVQEVEGYRTDVRVVNLQFLSSESYIDQMKRQQDKSAPLPIKMANNQYKDGTRDYFRYVDYGLKDSVELNDLLSILTSDNKDDKIEMNDGTLENFLPTKKFKLSIDKTQILATNTVSKADESKIASEMEWTFPKDNAYKGDLAMLDIIQNNNWKRPIYFSIGVSNDSYIGLDKYLYMEGAAYRLLPIEAKTETDKYENTNTMLAFKHYQNFEFAGYKTAKYLDPESRRVLQGTWSFANSLATNLLKENKTAMAKKVVEKSINELLLRNWSISDTVNKISLVENMHYIKLDSKAVAISQNTASFIAQEFDYILSLSANEQAVMINDIKRGMYVLQSLAEIAKKHNQNSLNQSLNNKLNIYNERFMQSLG